ncbi:MAG: NAD(P)-dependent oxidoreductase [Acidimicrobiia bacterium]|nr:NAD(P)-dependent oxidoreductase [Acidimicrobiia bacterium]
MELAKKRFLVTGAGCLGSALVRRLLNDGAIVSVVDISKADLDALPNGAKTTIADVTDLVAMKEAVAEADIVVHTAAALGGPGELQARVNVAGTRTVAEAASEAGVDRLVHISSNAVYGIHQISDITEDTGLAPSLQDYSMTKAAGEEALFDVAATNGLRYTVIRPAGIFGPGAHYFAASFYKRGKRKPVLFIGKGSGAMHCSFVDDVADLITLAAVHPAAEGETFNCAIDPPPTQREYMAAWSRLSGHDRYLGVPMVLAKIGGFVTKPFAKHGTYLSQLNDNLDWIDRYVRIDASKAKELLGWEPAHTLESGVRATIPWLRQIGLMDGASFPTGGGFED